MTIPHLFLSPSREVSACEARQGHLPKPTVAFSTVVASAARYCLLYVKPSSSCQTKSQSAVTLLAWSGFTGSLMSPGQPLVPFRELRHSDFRMRWDHQDRA